MRPLVKICGITNIKDVGVAAASGADYIGIIVGIEHSPRSISIEKAGSIIDCSSVPVVVLLDKPCNEIADMLSGIRPYGIQLVGECLFNDVLPLKNITGCAVWKTVHLPQNNCGNFCSNDLFCTIEKCQKSGVDTIVLDTRIPGKKGGTGMICDWRTAARLVKTSSIPIFLAGGITSENVRDAVDQVNPCGIDLSSGVEEIPGKKDPEKISRLMDNLQVDRRHQYKGEMV